MSLAQLGGCLGESDANTQQAPCRTFPRLASEAVSGGPERWGELNAREHVQNMQGQLEQRQAGRG